MHLADRRTVVVDEADAAFSVTGLQSNFLLNFSEHRFTVRTVKEACVIRADVSAHADRAQGLQATLGRPLATSVMKNLGGLRSFLRRGKPAEYDVGDDLLEVWIGFHFG